MAKITRSIRIEGDIAIVPLTQGYEAVIDAKDVHLVDGFIWCADVRRRADGTIRSVYATRMGRQVGSKKYRNIRMHRVIADTPDDMETDHRDGNGLNNRRDNIRNATTSQNQCNARTPAHNSSGVRGVHLNKRNNRWVAQIGAGGKKIHIGIFDTIDDASAAYAAASKKIHGEFGRKK